MTQRKHSKQSFMLIFWTEHSMGFSIPDWVKYMYIFVPPLKSKVLFSRIDTNSCVLTPEAMEEKHKRKRMFLDSAWRMNIMIILLCLDLSSLFRLVCCQFFSQGGITLLLPPSSQAVVTVWIVNRAKLTHQTWTPFYHKEICCLFLTHTITATKEIGTDALGHYFWPMIITMISTRWHLI